MHEDLVPPESIEGRSDKEIDAWRTEFDVISGLEDLGHEVVQLGVADDIDLLRKTIAETRPDLCFNLLVEFHHAAGYDAHVVGYLELLRQHYTGCNPAGLTLARDKARSKMVLAWHGVPVPHFAVFPRGQKPLLPQDKPLEFPLFVKAVNEEASLGIAQASIVRSPKKLADRVAFVHEELETDAIAEEFIEGREVYMGVIGNERLRVSPPWELKFASLPKGTANVATRRVKWDLAYQKKLGVKNGPPGDLPNGVGPKLPAIARHAYRALGLSGYARLDLRIRPDGRPYVLEANPNPDLTFGEDFAEAAEHGGLPYDGLIQRIVQTGLSYEAGWAKD